MASGGNNFSARMPADQSIDDRFIRDILFNHFRRHKVEISKAIKKEFPFLEVLRDRDFITNRMYEDCQESCRNLVPVQRVVYNVLSQLEKTFQLPLLDALFSEANKQEYPDLNNIYKGFENAVHEALCQQDSDEESVENPNTQLSLEQGTSGSSYQCLTWIHPHPSDCNGTATAENRPSEDRRETEQTNVKRKGTTCNNKDAPGGQQANEQRAQESEPAESCKQVPIQGNYENAKTEAPSPLPSDDERAELPNHGIKINSCSVCLVDIKKEKPFFNSGVEKQTQTRTNYNHESDIIVISSEDSSDGDDRSKAFTREQRRKAESNKRGEIREVTYSAPKTASQAMDLRESPPCRKRLWKTGRSREGSSESSADEAPPRAGSCTVRRGPDEQGSSDIGKQPTLKMRNVKLRLVIGDSSESSNGEEPQETSSSALRNGSGAEIQGLGSKKCSCVMCSSNDVPRGQEAGTESSQASDTMGATDTGSRSTVEKHSGKRREKVRHINKINSLQRVRNRGRHRIQSLNNKVPWKRNNSKGIKAGNTGPLKRSRKRGPRIPRDTNMDFKPPILPVTCGQVKGMLYKEKMKEGISAKCVRTKDGKQLTLKEFEVEGSHERSKNWRLSVRCGGWPLKCLIQKGHLPDPPRTRRKTIPEFHSDEFIDPYPENFNECEVCRKRGKLFCCDTCPRSFHEKCHIRHIDPDRNPWSCIFCQIKSIQERCPESRPCQESEVLKRKMLHEEWLKCQFLLLKVYCCSESPFFASKPNNSEKSAEDLKKCMWLNKIRIKLTWKMYTQVKGFVQDMRLIFQNHRAIYRDHKFLRLGIQLEAKFEYHFKNIFAIQETSK